MNIILKKFRNLVKRWILYASNRDLLARNKALKDSQKGKRCFIIGSGPSIKNQDLSKLKDEETFAVTSFWNHPDHEYKKINPKYYTIFDPDIFPPPDGIQTKGLYLRDLFLAKADILASCPTKFFFHINAKALVEQYNILSKNEIYYLVFDGFFRDNLRFNLEIDKVLPYGKNVIVPTIIIAAFMGFEEIYLLGCDHDFLAYPEHYEGFKHFFEEPKYDSNNFQDVKKYALTVMPYEALIDNIKILFKNYRLLKSKLEKERPNVKIYNATPNSFLDVFPFIKYEDVITSI